MAAAVDPHVTVVHEATSLHSLLHLLRAVAPNLPPAELQLGPIARWSPPEDGLYVSARDVSGALADLRVALAGVIAPPPRPDMTYAPHVTLLHPATSPTTVIDAAVAALATWLPPAATFSVERVTVIRGAGLSWQVVEEVALGGAARR
jgi:hypothetical protein